MIEMHELKKLLKQSFNIILVTVIIGFTVNLVHPRGYVFIGREEINDGRIVNISIEEAKIKYDYKLAIFVDTRDGEDYTEGHINGALHIPTSPESLSYRKIKLNFDKLYQKKELVLYCGEGCDSSKVLARRILNKGYSRHIYVIPEGLPEWQERGFPTEGVRDNSANQSGE